MNNLSLIKDEIIDISLSQFWSGKIDDIYMVDNAINKFSIELLNTISLKFEDNELLQSEIIYLTNSYLK